MLKVHVIGKIKINFYFFNITFNNNFIYIIIEKLLFNYLIIKLLIIS